MICLVCWKDHIWPWHIGLRWAIVALWVTCILFSLFCVDFITNESFSVYWSLRIVCDMCEPLFSCWCVRISNRGSLQWPFGGLRGILYPGQRGQYSPRSGGRCLVYYSGNIMHSCLRIFLYLRKIFWIQKSLRKSDGIPNGYDDESDAGTTARSVSRTDSARSKTMGILRSTIWRSVRRTIFYVSSAVPVNLNQITPRRPMDELIWAT